ncbi:hypothetical protein [Desulfomonile tiedjei]|uniref:CBS domain-containing protein n=1 Tax=Desulfomonile tiedjei (strain ATCC 49306 / DSM 6799 / DCB-1) TaxID=706587 RepID=I4C261_DESTA|nr:hypothetical protein [Desulfomonile tiedjei]AFM23652.1 hypothetical protein Desti_0933 [Desulfomonile tiedjei DSM 6799]
MQVKELMIPLSDCAKIPADRNLFDAVMILEVSRQRLDRLDYRPRVVLVYDRELHIIGSLRQFDIMSGLISREKSGQGKLSIGEMIPDCRKALAEIFHTARVLKVREVMHPYSQDEYISEEASIEEGICKLVVGHFPNLIVQSGEISTGVFRLSDVFSMLSRDIKRSGLK